MLMKRILSTLALLGTLFLLPLMAQAQKCTITINPVEHATIKVTYGYTPPTVVNSGDQVNRNTRLTIQVTPEAGYVATHYIVNGTEKPITSSYGDSEWVEGDMIISAKVVAVTPCTVTITQPTEGGTLTVNTTKPYKIIKSGDNVDSGTTIRLSVTPSEGYDIDYWLIDGQRVNPFEDKLIRYGISHLVMKDVTVSVKLKDISQPNPTEGKITMIQPQHGTLTAYYFSDGNTVDVTDGATVPLETDVTFHVAPAEGYEMDYWLVNNVQTELGVGSLVNNKTITVTGDLEVKPVLKAKATVTPTEATLTITREGTGGTVTGKYLTPDGMTFSIWEGNTKQVPLDTKVTLTASLTPGFEVTYTNNGNPVPAEALSDEGKVYTFTVNGDATVVAKITEKKVTGKFTVKCVADPTEGGEVLASTAEGPITDETKVAGGTFITVNATAKENFEVDQWFLDDKELKDKKGQASYTFALTEDVTIKVTFKSTLPPAEYAVTVEPVLPSAKAGTVQLFKKDGSVVASGKTVVTGTEMYVEVKPADKYELETLQVNNTTIKAGDEKLIKLAGGGVKYAFTVTEATTIKATFKLVNAIEQLAQSDVAVYVTNDGTRLEVAGAAEGAEVRLYDYTGQLLLTSTEHALDISALPAGSYIVLVGNYTTRIVK